MSPVLSQSLRRRALAQIVAGIAGNMDWYVGASAQFLRIDYTEHFVNQHYSRTKLAQTRCRSRRQPQRSLSVTCSVFGDGTKYFETEPFRVAPRAQTTITISLWSSAGCSEAKPTDDPTDRSWSEHSIVQHRPEHAVNGGSSTTGDP